MFSYLNDEESNESINSKTDTFYVTKFQVVKERDSARKKLEAMTAQFLKLKKELQDEKQLSQCLLTDQKEWQSQLEELKVNTMKAKKESDEKVSLI